MCVCVCARSFPLINGLILPPQGGGGYKSLFAPLGGWVGDKSLLVALGGGDANQCIKTQCFYYGDFKSVKNKDK